MRTTFILNDAHPGLQYFGYRDVLLLRQFLSPEGYIIGRRYTKICPKLQKRVARCIKRSRKMGKLLYTQHEMKMSQNLCPRTIILISVAFNAKLLFFNAIGLLPNFKAQDSKTPTTQAWTHSINYYITFFKISIRQRTLTFLKCIK